ncbi:hypothetical protein KXD97_19105 [Mycobacterium sp. SMC-8]|uniref:endonuclease/exonuclease/phosphatase family protein n=1 Tax=Mycobacterium sp. SMC-8 TaxID=2857060 RepID=UPI0021B39077|nr:endonuclease/exonuclease/phosphatase family protein [Mycobacterium sp. SMC-8]UXA10246.1 hypothetical protein KXD97_19105 [Mycobacterium sp. SMC-8]
MSSRRRQADLPLIVAGNDTRDDTDKPADRKSTEEWRVVALNILHGGGSRVDALARRLLSYDADVLVLTEFRPTGTGKILIDRLEASGYEVSYPAPVIQNSVLVAARAGINRAWAFSDELEARRLWCVDVDGLVVCGVGMPNKYAKLPYWEALVDSGRSGWVDLFVGDFNTGDNNLDKDPRGARFVAAEMPGRLVETGYVDLWRSAHAGVREYSWFSNTGNGFRIDHAFATPKLARTVTGCEFDHAPRVEQETDHSALIVSFTRAPTGNAALTPRLLEEITRCLDASPMRHGVVFRGMRAGLTAEQMASESGKSVAHIKKFMRSVDLLLTGQLPGPGPTRMALTNSYVYRELKNFSISTELSHYVDLRLRELQGLNSDIDIKEPLKRRSLPRATSARCKVAPPEALK